MPLDKAQLEELKRLSPDLEVYEEGEMPYILLPKLKLPAGCTPAEIDALLCPVLKDGYHSRLYFAQRIECGKALNWTVNGASIINRIWHAYSWQLHRPRRLIEMVAEHLRALR